MKLSEFFEMMGGQERGEEWEELLAAECEIIQDAKPFSDFTVAEIAGWGYVVNTSTGNHFFDTLEEVRDAYNIKEAE